MPTWATPKTNWAAQDTITTTDLNRIEENIACFSGIICMWAGSIASIPSGWFLCDGNNGTPNMADKFVRGTITSPGTTGGSDSHGHTVNGHSHTMPDHAHNYNHNHSASAGVGSQQQLVFESGVNRYGNNVNHGHAITVDTRVANTSGYIAVSEVSLETSAVSPGTNSISNVPAYLAMAFIKKT